MLFYDDDDDGMDIDGFEEVDDLLEEDNDAFLRRSLMRGGLDDEEDDEADNPLNWSLTSAIEDDEEMDELDDHFSPADRAEL